MEKLVAAVSLGDISLTFKLKREALTSWLGGMFAHPEEGFNPTIVKNLLCRTKSSKPLRAPGSRREEVSEFESYTTGSVQSYVIFGSDA